MKNMKYDNMTIILSITKYFIHNSNNNKEDELQHRLVG